MPWVGFCLNLVIFKKLLFQALEDQALIKAEKQVDIFFKTEILQQPLLGIMVTVRICSIETVQPSPKILTLPVCHRSMNCVERIYSLTNFSPNKRSTTNFSILNHT